MSDSHGSADLLTGLPTQPTPFIGRETEVARVTGLLSTEARLLVLTGPGGTGKTRLALQVAELLSGEFEDGVVWVSLESVTEPNLVVESIGRELGIEQKGSIPIGHLLSRYLRTRQVLLVLDCFEQVVTAAPSVADLVADCAHLTVMVTSREILHLQGERDFPVPPLSLPDTGAADNAEGNWVASLLESEAVALFVDRAKAANPDFSVNSGNGFVVAEICRRLEGLPLAIELAAARIRLFSPAKMIERLDNSLSLLTRGAKDRPSRQQTLRGTIDWSYDLLEEAERRVFGRLAVFVGGFTLEAAEQVCRPANDDDCDVLDSIASLVEKSLIKRDDSGGEQRFAMLETVRDYAAERLFESGELEVVRQRHAAYFSGFAAEAEPELQGMNRQLWADRLESEHANFRSAVAWGFASGHEELALELFRLVFLHVSAEFYVEARDWIDTAIADDRQPTALLADVILRAGNYLRDRGDETRGMSLMERGLAMSRRLGDGDGVSFALYRIGTWAFWDGDSSEAATYLNESLSISRQSGTSRWIPYALHILSQITAESGDLERAQTLCQESLKYFEQVSNHVRVALVQQTLGTIAMLKGDLALAADLTERSLAVLRETGYPYFIGMALLQLGTICLKQAALGKAKNILEEAIQMFGEIAMKWGMSDANKWIGRCLMQCADIAATRHQLERSVVLLGASVIFGEHINNWMERWRDWSDELCKSARNQLGNKRFQALLREGQGMSLEEAISYASEDGQSTDAAAAPTSFPDGLTRREVDVAALLVEGLTNREIGERLFIAERTVANHVQSVLNKTGSGNRAEAAAYAIRHGLTD